LEKIFIERFSMFWITGTSPIGLSPLAKLGNPDVSEIF
jgi:hypothetical protein